MKEICWNITSRCNQKCGYCHRFLNIKELSWEENLEILKGLIRDGVTDITWTGGEALLFDGLDILLKYAYYHGIKSKIITNGNLLTSNCLLRIGKYLDSITLSIDSTNNEINQKIGRGYNHFFKVRNVLNMLSDKYPNIKIRINSVISKYSIDGLKELTQFLNNYNIYSWRLFKFMSLRELAVINKRRFEITTDEYNELVSYVKENSNARKIEYRLEENMENNYVLILANGDIYVTRNGVDVKIGNALFDKVNV